MRTSDDFVDSKVLMAMRRRRHAVVVGGSLAGMLAARVLSDHFAAVTLIERDQFPETPAARKGLPQGRHVHGLLGRGREVLGAVLPGPDRRAGAGRRGADRRDPGCRLDECVRLVRSVPRGSAIARLQPRPDRLGSPRPSRCDPKRVDPPRNRRRRADPQARRQRRRRRGAAPDSLGRPRSRPEQGGVSRRLGSGGRRP